MGSYRFIPGYSADALLDVQNKGLAWTLDHVWKNSPQYRAKLEAAGVTPADIKSAADLARLPCTTTEDLREGYPLPLLSVPEKDVVRIHASSGTTGKRKILAYTAKDVDMFNTQMARCFELTGVTDRDRVQVAVGYGLWTAGVGFQGGIEKLGAMAVPVGAGNLEAHLQMLVDMGTTCLGSTASMALLMGEEVQRNGLMDKVKLKRVVFGAEGHNKKMRKTFETNLGLTDGSYDIAGMTEMYGPGSGIECAAHAGIHYWGDLFILEVLDPVTLVPVKPGEIGELVATSLCKEAVPLIRYRTRDLTRLLPGECPCGCSMPRHDHILGRSDDMIVFRGVNIYPGQIADVLQEVAELGSEYHMELTRKGGRDEMALKIERRSGFSCDLDDAVASRVARRLHAKVMIAADVEIVDPGTLPRSFGKSKRVTDRRFDEGAD
ncbi:Phenylacetate-coenzyme A ligase [uncultured delta proteobacterium]|uniref:Phenylacetate-coenzyme A ligase n=1 Tax=uncultured delta proteobacterium TaxID=34034 RepID=A0A212KDF8_9DELT|nr:Phenylacetate-coenzyme A ligase [uncultured delta proteobacterium]